MGQHLLHDHLRQRLEREERTTMATIVAPERSGDAPVLGQKLLIDPDGATFGDLTPPGLADLVRSHVVGTPSLATGIESFAASGETFEVFLEVHEPPPKLIIVGAVHVAIHLVAFAQRLGFRCLVVDARAAFATAERFPDADELIVRWPADYLAEIPIHDSTFCVFLTHDPKLDDPALQVALERGARYVGALGSRRTHAKRVVSLHELGVPTEQIERIHAPIGLPLGGRRPEEIAIAIAAEIVQARYGPGPT